MKQSTKSFEPTNRARPLFHLQFPPHNTRGPNLQNIKRSSVDQVHIKVNERQRRIARRKFGLLSEVQQWDAGQQWCLILAIINTGDRQ